MKDLRPEEFQDAVEFDNAIRNTGNEGELFIHQSLTPLGEVDLRSDLDRGQVALFGEECEGMCGV